jgi:hypothetical protein
MSTCTQRVHAMNACTRTCGYAKMERTAGFSVITFAFAEARGCLYTPDDEQGVSRFTHTLTHTHTHSQQITSKVAFTSAKCVALKLNVLPVNKAQDQRPNPLLPDQGVEGRAQGRVCCRWN